MTDKLRLYRELARQARGLISLSEASVHQRCRPNDCSGLCRNLQQWRLEYEAIHVEAEIAMPEHLKDVNEYRAFLAGRLR